MKTLTDIKYKNTVKVSNIKRQKYKIIINFHKNTFISLYKNKDYIQKHRRKNPVVNS